MSVCISSPEDFFSIFLFVVYVVLPSAVVGTNQSMRKKLLGNIVGLAKETYTKIACSNTAVFPYVND